MPTRTARFNTTKSLHASGRAEIRSSSTSYLPSRIRIFFERRLPRAATLMQSELVRHLAKGAAGTFSLKTLGLVFSFVTAVVLARLLNATGYGVYAYAVSWATLLYVPGMLGLDILLVRNVASFEATADFARLRGLLAGAYIAVGVASVVIAFSAGLALAWIGVTPDVLPAVLLAMLLVPLMSITRISAAGLRGLHRVVLGQLPEFGLRPPLLLGLLGVFAILLGPSFGPVAAVAAFVLAAAVGAAVGVWQLWSHAWPLISGVSARYEFRRWAVSALPLLLIGGLGVVNTQTDIVLLGTLRGPADAGIYRVASRGAEFIEFVLLAVNAPLAPMIARVYVQGESARLQRLITSSARVITLLSAPLAASLIVFGNVYLGLFGSEFTDGRAALSILALAQMVNAFFGSVGIALTMTGHERDSLRGLLVAAVVNVGLNVLLIPALGTVGAALATGSSIVVWNVLLGVLVVRRLGLTPTAFGLRFGLRR